MIIGFIGNLGSGKTISLVRMAYSYYKKGYKVYSNIKLSFPHETLSFKDFENYARSNEQFTKSFFLIDEIHVALDSRRSGSKTNIVISHLILQSRKRQIQIGFTTQHFSQIDMRLRNQTDIVGVCSAKTFKQYKIISVNYMVFLAQGVTQHLKRFLANKYYGLYDTNEIVSIT